MRIIYEAAKTMINAKNFLKSLWAEVVNTAMFLLNYTSNSSQVSKIPYEL